MALTEEQIKVRDTRKKNMLVSAAAGSGKTFVLVERIISEILDEKNGIDVDRILVVTFTTAAAAEMKDRIRVAIDKAVTEKADNGRIRSQATLIHNAQIRTIDSFCNWVVKNYFYEINMDPSFRVGTAGELKMLSDEVFSDLLSKRLQENEADFRLLADAYIVGRNVDTLKNMIFELHAKATSFAWVDEWYDNALRIYDIDSIEALQESDFMKALLDYTNMSLDSIIGRIKRFLSLYTVDCDSKDKTIFSNELSYFTAIYDAATYEEKRVLFDGFDPERWSSKNTSLNEYEAQQAKDFRYDYKKMIESLKADFFNLSVEELFDSLIYVKRQAVALIDFARDYSDALMAEKRKKNIFDFNDVEHMALEILRNKESKEHEKRPVALELCHHFKEVMVDEYQDSNELQEQILTAVSSDNNYFTVGDVKQSIYAFRQASPQLFIDKLSTYPQDDSSDSVRIDLDSNFRSRGEVLHFCNQVFRPLMQPDMGGVIYDEKAALKVGDDTFKGDSKVYEPEIIIATQNSEDMASMDIDNADELEARVVASRIKRLIAEGFQVSDKGADGRTLRPMKLSDVVILMRATTGHADKYISVLKDSGIPAYVAEEKGFFEREEIETVLSMLKIIDNPFDDIPLAAVLHSPMFGFSSNRLAQIRATDGKSPLYTCLKEFCEKHSADDVRYFLDSLEKHRNATVDTPIHKMIERVLADTGYGLYVSALPLGKMARANLDKLIDEAVAFESTSFKGLSRFVSYIEGLKSYDEDLGVAKTVGENDNAVRIMTIHKSKGLEFPVCFVSGMGRGFKDESGTFAYDNSLGLALNYRDPKERITFKTSFYNLIKKKVSASSKGELLRILYVALTRPVDKLIITASIKPTSKKSVPDIIADYTANDTILDYYTKEKAQSSIELIIRALNASAADYNRTIVDCSQLFVQEVEKSLVKEQARRLIEEIKSKNLEEDNPIVNTVSFDYEGSADSKYKNKYSVSEIKHQAMEMAFEFNADAAPAFIHTEDEAYVPQFMMKELTDTSIDAGDKVPAGALYGTAMHRFMECFDFAREDFASSFNEQLSYMTNVHSLSEDEQKRINYKKLQGFLNDDIANRMSKAALNGKLYKEKPFVYGSNGKELFGDESSTDEMLLVQGIIDVFFEEDDGIVLLDYKTDRVDEDSQLVLRYEKQLQLYKAAIEKAYNIPVKEVLLYSFALEKTIGV